MALSFRRRKTIILSGLFRLGLSASNLNLWLHVNGIYGITIQFTDLSHRVS